MARLQTLNPRVGAMPGKRLAQLDPIGGTQRTRGRAWMRRREAWLIAHPACCDCGRVAHDNEVDHDTPLWAGGADDEANYRTRCKECHKAKTAREASARARG